MNGAVDIETYLTKNDPKLGHLIAIVRAHRGEPMRPPAPTGSPFEALVRAVIYQRISETAGATVYSKLEKIAGGKLTPKRIAELTTARIRTAGLALSKSTYIGNLATWFMDNPKTADRLPSMSDQEIIEALTSISGVGLWTVNVLLVFNLGRLDVAPAPDVIIRRVAQLVYGLGNPALGRFRQREDGTLATLSIYREYVFLAGDQTQDHCRRHQTRPEQVRRSCSAQRNMKSPPRH
jgi:DNA-3-methyladenine glycosylase II